MEKTINRIKAAASAVSQTAASAVLLCLLSAVLALGAWAETVTTRTTVPENGSVTLKTDATYTVNYENGVNRTEGGAVNVALGGKLQGTRVTFKNSTAKDSEGGWSYGGAIFFSGATGTFDGECTFSGNNATVTEIATCYGGALYLRSNGKKWYETGSTVTFNSPVNFDGNSAIANIQTIQTDFKSATAAAYGGAIGIATASALKFMDDVTFTGSKATVTVGQNPDNKEVIVNAFGGAIYLSGSVTFPVPKVTFGKNATFNGNSCSASGAITTSTLGGGAIYNSIADVEMCGQVSLLTASDTWENEGGYNYIASTQVEQIRPAIVYWNLTQGLAQYGSIGNFQYYSNKKTAISRTGGQEVLVDQRLTVKASGQETGDYVIASGDFSLETLQNNNSTEFVLTNAMGGASIDIAINGNAVVYNDRLYKLALKESTTAGEDKLILTAALPKVTVAAVANATVAVYTNGTVEVAGPPYVVEPNAQVKVVYTAVPGYAFPDNTTTFTTNFTVSAAETTVKLADDQLPKPLPPVVVEVSAPEGATAAVYSNAVDAANLVPAGGTVLSNSIAFVVYTVTEEGKCFENGEREVVNRLDTANDPAKDKSAYVPNAVGTPLVKLGIVAQRYPWNGVLDIQYKTPYANAATFVTFKANGTEIGTAKGTGGSVKTAEIDLNTAADGAFKNKALKNVKITATID